MSEILAGELVVQALKENDIETVFGLVGNQISPIMVCAEKYGIEIIGARHEQAAVLMADGWSQVKRKTGVAMVSGGPGFSNCVSSVIKAYFANTPLLVIVGASVTTKKDRNELQDLDQVGFIKQYTKWSASVTDPSRIKEYIYKALYLAQTGKRGPVVLEIPINILKAKVNEDKISGFNKDNLIWSINENCASRKQLDFIVDKLDTSEKPIVLVGDSAYYLFAEKALNEFADLVDLPIYTLGKARGMLSDKHPNCFGNGRMLDAGEQLFALKNADLILGFGLTDNYETDLSSCEIYDPNATIINIDLDFNENIFCDKKQHIFFQANVCNVLEQLNESIRSNDLKIEHSKWKKEVLDESEKQYLNMLQNINKDDIHPLNIINKINDVMDTNDTIVVLDGSNAMFWGTYGFRFDRTGAFINGPDGTLGPMGCGLALALGAKAAAREKRVVLYTGDGSFGFNISELDTAKRYDLPITIIVHNDTSWGLCKSTQEILYNATAGVDLKDVRYDKIVGAFGGDGILVEEMSEELKNKIGETIEKDELFCFNVIFPSRLFSPGTIDFNRLLEKMK